MSKYIQISDIVHKEIKICAAKEGVSMKEVLEILWKKFKDVIYFPVKTICGICKKPHVSCLLMERMGGPMMQICNGCVGGYINYRKLEYDYGRDKDDM